MAMNLQLNKIAEDVKRLSSLSNKEVFSEDYAASCLSQKAMR